MKKYPKLLSIMSSLEMVGWWPLYVRTMSLNMQSQFPFREGLKKVWNFPYLSGFGKFEKVIFHKKKMKKTWSKNA